MNRFTENTTGSINIVPGNPAIIDPTQLNPTALDSSPTPALTFACLGCNSANPTSALDIVRDPNGAVPGTAVCTLFTLTTDAPTIIDTGVTVASGGPVYMRVNGGSGN